MEVRRTLEEPIEPRQLKASELREGFCVKLRDPYYNAQFLFVGAISDTEIVFESLIHSEAKKFQIILTRDGDTLRDAKGRKITVTGKPKQYDSEGKEL